MRVRLQYSNKYAHETQKTNRYGSIEKRKRKETSILNLEKKEKLGDYLFSFTTLLMVLPVLLAQ
jgi:hypothetical protein